MSWSVTSGFARGSPTCSLRSTTPPNAQAEIAAADHPRIRLVNLPQARNLAPLEDIPAIWTACTPKTVGGFSAVGYFFGRDLLRELNVPIGLINASWGGSSVEAWIPREPLLAVPGIADTLQAPSEALADHWRDHHASPLNDWFEALGIKNESGATVAGNFARRDLDDTAWNSMTLPTYWQDAGAWHQRRGVVPQDVRPARRFHRRARGSFPWRHRRPRLHVCQRPAGWPHPRGLSGVLACPAPLCGSARRSHPPARNVVAVRAVDIGGNGGLIGPAEAMEVTSGSITVPLAGKWKYAVECPLVIPPDKPRPMDLGDLMATELYNAMVHPLIPYAIRGVIWYQGEANTGNPARYGKLLPALIQSWRRGWGHDFPFLIVQLAGFMAASNDPAANPEWAIFRDVQRQVAAQTPCCSLAVAADIGDPSDIHPRNKQAVGHRLARQALKNVYGLAVAATGPTFNSLAINGNRLIIAFDHLAGGLRAKDNSLDASFAIQGQDGKWEWADAAIAGATVVVSHPAITRPVAVRYAWQNHPNASLYNQAGLPAVPFQAALPMANP